MASSVLRLAFSWRRRWFSARSISMCWRSARSARSMALRRRAAAASASGSAGIVGLQRLEAVDDADQIQPDGLVHLDQPLAAVGVGLRDQLLGPGELVAVCRQELGGGEEAVAGQAGVGVRAGLLQGQAAVAVGQRLLGAREVLQRPRG